MDFSAKNKAFLEELTIKLELEVDTKGKKPTKDELIVALEKVEPEVLAKTLEEMGIEDAGPKDELVAEDAPVYIYKKGDKDPTTYNVIDPEYGHVDGPKHLAWKKVNG